ncbi:MAG: CoA transferase, partial [Chitinophagales bacterium]
AKEFAGQNNPKKWGEYKAKFEAIFKSKTRDEWCEIMEGTDICFAPVLDYLEAQKHPHNVERETYIKVDGIIQPAPAPRFSRTVSEVQSGSPAAGEHTEEVLKEWLG